MNSKRKLAGIINRRKSERAFKSTSLAKTVLLNCLEAARWAPSNGNAQPWRFIVVHKNSSRRKAVEASLARGNAWAIAAPTLVVTCASKKDDGLDGGTEYYGYDTGMAVMNFVLQAQHEGLRCHQMAGFDHVAVKRALRIPGHATVFAIMAVGYPGALSTLDEHTRSKERKLRTRKSIQDIAYGDTYDNPLR